jgi:hypothetical protein
MSVAFGLLKKSLSINGYIQSVALPVNFWREKFICAVYNSSVNCVATEQGLWPLTHPNGLFGAGGCLLWESLKKNKSTVWAKCRIP